MPAESWPFVRQNHDAQKRVKQQAGEAILVVTPLDLPGIWKWVLGFFAHYQHLVLDLEDPEKDFHQGQQNLYHCLGLEKFL